LLDYLIFIQAVSIYKGFVMPGDATNIESTKNIFEPGNQDQHHWH